MAPMNFILKLLEGSHSVQVFAVLQWKGHLYLEDLGAAGKENGDLFTANNLTHCRQGCLGWLCTLSWLVPTVMPPPWEKSGSLCCLFSE
ncbi:hypothetical protein ATANTOWER_001893 [Ataeniobius toweri]|uniref:Uncharacterized protein n=1 Tax=Ataeniobius toweri TaxID=208326 RepID=A0ABU7BEP4_9TELE|nr:hypothetical protein [Ataeniobius toweri]